MALAGEVRVRVTVLSVAPGFMVTEALFLEQVQPVGQAWVRLKVEEPQPAESLLIILKLKVLASPGFPVWGELVGVTVGLALEKTVSKIKNVEFSELVNNLT